MPRINSTWLIGSVESLPAQSFTINAGAASISAGSYYLYHGTNSLSLMYQLQAALTTAGVAGASVVLLENRCVRVSAGGVFSITWGSATALRDFLGFTGNLAGQSSYTATNISRYLWSAGETVSKATATGSAGYSVEDATIKVSADGTHQYTDHHITHTWDDWEFPSVLLNRYDSLGAWSGGTFLGFRTAVIVPGHRFQCYEIVTEDNSSTSQVTLPTALGTYRMRAIPAGHGKRKIEHANSYWGVSMDVRLTGEYD